MKLDFEYGRGMMTAELPEYTDIFVPGVSYPDPECLPEESLYEETLKSVRNPIGMPPLSELAHKGSRVVIIIPDIVKGGCQPTSHRKVSIRVILGELYAAGVDKNNITLLFSNGLHPRTNEKEARQILGDDLYDEFNSIGRVTSHDSEDYDNLVDLGTTPRGDRVIMNKLVYDSDIAILIGHTQGNPYGGYSGGYKHCATGITHWKSIATHHVPSVMHRKDFVPVSTHSLMRTKFDEIGMYMEERMGKKFFLLRCGARLQEPPDSYIQWLGEGNAAPLVGDRRQAHICPLGREKVRRNSVRYAAGLPLRQRNGHKPHPANAGAFRPGHTP